MKTNDLTQGSIGKGFVLFAIPLFLGSLFQQLYNTVDKHAFCAEMCLARESAAASCRREQYSGDLF